jgi:hypothetical protein
MKRIALALTFALLVCSSLFAANPKDPPAITLPVTYYFLNIQYPADTLDVLLGINNAGYMVGQHGAEISRGFTIVPTDNCPPTCNFKPENYPGSIQTGVAGINNDYGPMYETAGFWIDKAGTHHGFMRNSKAWIDVDYPGTTRNFLYGLNDNNMAAGFYYDGVFNAHPYIYSQPGNQYAPLFIAGVDSAWAYGINDYNQIVGTYYDPSGSYHGFEFSPFFTALNYPGASDTYAMGINNYGAIVGYFHDAAGYHGFIYYGGTWEQIDNPDAFGATYVSGINDIWYIVGYGGEWPTYFGFEAYQ